jgi:hypothetical protein
MDKPSSFGQLTPRSLNAMMLRAGFHHGRQLSSVTGIMYGTLNAYLHGKPAILTLRHRVALAGVFGSARMLHADPRAQLEAVAKLRRRIDLKEKTAAPRSVQQASSAALRRLNQGVFGQAALARPAYTR